VGEEERAGVKLMNVAARGEPMSLEDCAKLANAKVIRIPTRWLTSKMIQIAWAIGASSVPPDAFPYLCGSYTMDTSALKRYLGPAYADVIHYTNESALRATFDEA
jgi:hypothetical protein